MRMRLVFDGFWGNDEIAQALSTGQLHAGTSFLVEIQGIDEDVELTLKQGIQQGLSARVILKAPTLAREDINEQR